MEVGCFLRLKLGFLFEEGEEAAPTVKLLSQQEYYRLDQKNIIPLSTMCHLITRYKRLFFSRIAVLHKGASRI